MLDSWFGQVWRARATQPEPDAVENKAEGSSFLEVGKATGGSTCISELPSDG